MSRSLNELADAATRVCENITTDFDATPSMESNQVVQDAINPSAGTTRRQPRYIGSSHGSYPPLQPYMRGKQPAPPTWATVRNTINPNTTDSVRRFLLSIDNNETGTKKFTLIPTESLLTQMIYYGYEIDVLADFICVHMSSSAKRNANGYKDVYYSLMPQLINNKIKKGCSFDVKPACVLTGVNSIHRFKFNNLLGESLLIPFSGIFDAIKKREVPLFIEDNFTLILIHIHGSILPDDTINVNGKTSLIMLESLIKLGYFYKAGPLKCTASTCSMPLYSYLVSNLDLTNESAKYYCDFVEANYPRIPKSYLQGTEALHQHGKIM